jgi:hypothetical protein
MGNDKVGSKRVCLKCNSLWGKVCDKLNKKYDRGDEHFFGVWSKHWEIEFAKFFNEKERVQFD